MDKNSRGIADIIAIILVLIIIGLVGYIVFNNIKPSPTKDKQETSITTSDEEIKAESTFQEVLDQGCKFNDNIDILPGDLPITISSDVDIKYNKDGKTVRCGGIDKQKFVSLTLDGIYVNIYDKHSNELGHGGYSFFGSLPNKIGHKDYIEFSMALSWPEGGCASPDYLSVYIRGVKAMWGDNNSFTINTSVEAIKPDDERLQSIYKKYSIDCEHSGTEKYYDVTYGAEQEVESVLFSNFDNLVGPEKETVDNIIEVFSKIEKK